MSCGDMHVSQGLCGGGVILCQLGLNFPDGLLHALHVPHVDTLLLFPLLLAQEPSVLALLHPVDRQMVVQVLPDKQ